MPDDSNKAAIVVFARLPVPGKAKTRLAASVGDEAAAEFYKLCAEQTFHSAYSCQSADAVVFCSAAAEVAAVQDWLQYNNTPIPVHAQQATADLGQRMLAALTAVAVGAAASSLPCGTATVALPRDSHSSDSMQQQAAGHMEPTDVTRQQQQQEEEEAAGGQTDQNSYSTNSMQQQKGGQAQLIKVETQQQHQHQHQQQQQQEEEAWGQTAHSSYSTDSMQEQKDGQAKVTGIKPQQQQQQQQQQQEQQKEGEAAGPTAHNLALKYDAVLVVGTDIPELTVDVLDQAVAALNTYDMVLGPAKDGGFYLMGFRSPALLNPEVQSGWLFESVQWSTETVLQRTVEGAGRVGLDLAPIDSLPALQDIDILQDLEAWFTHAATAVAWESGELCQPQQQQQSGQRQQSNTAAAAAASKAATGGSRHSSGSSSVANKQLQRELQQKRAPLVACVKSLLQK